MNTTNLENADRTIAGTETIDPLSAVGGDAAAAVTEPRASTGRRTDADTTRCGTMPTVRAANNKRQLVLKKLRAPRGATVEALMQATGWQAHSVRGFVSGTVRKKLGFTVVSEIGKGGVRRYRILSRA